MNEKNSWLEENLEGSNYVKFPKEDFKGEKDLTIKCSEPEFYDDEFEGRVINMAKFLVEEDGEEKSLTTGKFGSESLYGGLQAACKLAGKTFDTKVKIEWAGMGRNRRYKVTLLSSALT